MLMKLNCLGSLNATERKVCNTDWQFNIFEAYCIEKQKIGSKNAYCLKDTHGM